MATAMQNAVKSKILETLGERQRANAQEIEEATEIPRSTVYDHLRHLMQMGLIECIEAKATRGALQRYYRHAEGTLFIEDDELMHLDPKKRDVVNIRVLQTTTRDAASAFSERKPMRLAGELFSSARALVDQEGWEELVAIHRRAVEEMERVRRMSSERLRSGGGSAIKATSGIFLFELPLAPAELQSEICSPRPGAST